MKGKFMRLCGVLAATAVLSFGCSDATRPVAPAEEPANGLLGTVLGIVRQVLTPVSVLQREAPLATNISVTQRIGAEGGTIEIPQAGIRVVFPQNAVVLPGRQTHVDITVTALQGSGVAYTFQPHGLVFRHPVMISQDVQGTLAGRNRSLLPRVEGAYFPSLSNLNLLSGLASVLEFRPTQVTTDGDRIVFTVDHFSGYLIASGRR